MNPHTCTQHQPGAYACYSKHACKCEPCRTEGRRQRKLADYRRATNTRNRVDAAPVRAHVARLLEVGMGRAEVARLADVETVSITRLLSGESREVRRDRAARILAVTPPDVTRQETGTVDACGLARRVEALALLGWSVHRVMNLAGINRNTYAHARRTGRCFAASRAAVAVLYADLWDQAPPATSGTAWVVARARREGYQPAAAWDDGHGPHGIDNPTATPVGVRKLDQARRRYGDTALELSEAIDGGATLGDLEARYGMRWPSIERALHRAGLHDHADRVRPLGLNGGHNQHTRKAAA